MKINKIIVGVMLFMSVALFAQDKNDKKVMKDASKAKAMFMKTDKDMNDFFSNSEAYVIFPNIGKGGLIVGASAGNGVVYENGVAVAMAKVKKLDVGLQAGGKVFSEVIFFENEASYNSFKSDDFAFTGNVSAVMLKSGASREAKYRDGVAVFAHPKSGLMVDLSVGGQKFDYIPF